MTRVRLTDEQLWQLATFILAGLAFGQAFIPALPAIIERLSQW